MINPWPVLLDRLTAVQPVPQPTTVAVLGVAALALVVLAWPLTRMAVTVAHEAGHAIIAVLTGRQLKGIRLHSDTSGLTVSRGRPRGPGMVATLLAGYPAPGLLGLGAALLLASGRAVLVVALLVVVLAAMLVMVRNLYGLLVLLFGLAAVAAAAWYLSPLHQSWLAYLITWTLLLAAPRPVIELARHRAGNSDSAQLARITRIPALLWTVAFAATTVACLIAGLGVLAPGVLRLGA
ncbi:MAG: M50 family metallopeptidase [Propionibacteriaceae bacterium]|nr:M50 family metallopeptidase [Propionibacteriaceae bacterium]